MANAAKKPKRSRTGIELLKAAVKRPKGIKFPQPKVTVRRGFSKR